MQTGTYISGAGHLVLIGWAMLAGVFNADPPTPLDVTEVTMISGEAFAELTNTPVPVAPDVASDEPQAPDPQATDQAVPALPETDTPPPDQQAPPPVAPSPDEAVPDLSTLAPLPRAEVEDATPEAPDAPPTPPGASLVLNPDRAPKPRPAPRVAPMPAPASEPDAQVADSVTESATPVPADEATQETQEAKAPPEATTEIVTEAEEAGGKVLAPTTSMRPKSRPARREIAQETPSDAIADAVAEAVSNTAPEAGAAQQADVPTGPPMTFGEKDALRVSVQNCWNTGALSSEALRVTVTVAVSMKQDGTPDIGTIRQIGAEGGSGAAVRQAFETARRAIIICGAKGFDLPPEKYAQWRDIEMVFNPEKMRIK